jgi:N-acetylglucosaminyldiphosphoundecaprenol N-acetyl-beta-D-mannosaminyltransferase
MVEVSQSTPGRLRLSVLGITVTPMTPIAIPATIDKYIDTGDVRFVVYQNLHSIYLLQNNLSFREFLESSDLVLIDGYPIYIAARLAVRQRHGYKKQIRRIGSQDWLHLLSQAKSMKRLALIGTTTDSNTRAVMTLKDRFLNVEVLGIPGSNWNEQQAKGALSALTKFRPNVVLVGLGMPSQEIFLASYRDELPGAVYVTVGGALDQISGTQRGAPRILGPLGVEWLWRLALEPRRLSHRYLVEPWKLLWCIVTRGRRESKSQEARRLRID